MGDEIKIKISTVGDAEASASIGRVATAAKTAWKDSLPPQKITDYFEEVAKRTQTVATQTSQVIKVNYSAIAAESQRAIAGMQRVTASGRLSYAELSRGSVVIGNMTTGTNALAQAVSRVPNLASLLGLNAIGIGVEKVRALVSILGQVGTFVGAAGGVGLAATGGAAAGVGAIAYDLWALRELSRLKTDTLEGREQNNLKTLSKLGALTGDRLESGQLRGPQAEQVMEDIRRLSSLQYGSLGNSGLIRDVVGKDVQKQLPDLINRLRELTRSGYAVEEQDALQHAQALNQIESSRLDGEQDTLRKGYEVKMRDREASEDQQIEASKTFTERLRGIVEEQAFAKKDVLGVQSDQLTAQLGRTSNDPDALAKINSQLRAVADARIVIEQDRISRLEIIEAEQLGRIDQIQTKYADKRQKELEEEQKLREKMEADAERSAREQERAQERAYNLMRQALQDQLQASGSDWRKTNVQKFGTQAGLISGGAASGLLSGAEASAARNGLGPNPNSVSQQFQASVTALQNSMGTLAQNIAGTFTNVIGTAVDSVSNGLQKLIGDTEYWSKKLGSIAGPIMGSLTSGISKMFTTWIAQRALAAAKNIFFSEQEGAADTGAKAPGAMLTSISSWGIAAGVGAAAFLAAMALTGGFKTGGYTGDGSEGSIVGPAHGREYVFSAPMTKRYGVPALEAAHRGDLGPLARQAGGGGTTVNIMTYDSRQDAVAWSQGVRGEVWFLDMANKHIARA